MGIPQVLELADVGHHILTLVILPGQVFCSLNMHFEYSTNWFSNKPETCNEYPKLNSGQSNDSPQIIFNISYKFTYNNPY